VVDNFVYASSKGPVLVEIHGNPIAPRPVEDLAQMVLEEMKSSVVDRVVSFTVYPEEAPLPNIKIIALFDGAATQSGAKLCEGRAPSAAEPEREKINLRLVYCSDGERMSDVQGWIKRPENLDEARLRKLIWHATSSLLSSSDH